MKNKVTIFFKRFLVYDIFFTRVFSQKLKNSKVDLNTDIRCEICDYIGKPTNKAPVYYKWEIFFYMLPWNNVLDKGILNTDNKIEYYNRIVHFYCPDCKNEVFNQNLDLSDKNKKVLRKEYIKLYLRWVLLLLLLVALVVFL